MGRFKRRTAALCTALAMVAVACGDDGTGDVDPETGTGAGASTGDDSSDTEDGHEDAAADTEGGVAAVPVGEAIATDRVLRNGVFGADIGTMDPHQAVPGPDRQVVFAIFEGLVRYRPGDVTSGFEPELAVEIPETPEPDDDGTQTWEFELNEGIMCHAGPDNEPYELSLDEVVRSYEKSMNGDFSAFAGDYGDVVSVEATGERTIAFTLASPKSPELFLPLVADIGAGYVICMDAYEELGLDQVTQHPVGTGPYAFEMYEPSNNVQLTAFDQYWRDDQPLMAGIEFAFMADDSSRELALTAGEVDFIKGIDEGPWVERMDETDGLAAYAIPVGGLVFFQINTSIEPFDDERVRRAIMYATDRESHLALGGELAGEPFFTPAFGMANVPDGPGDVTEEEVLEAGFDWAVEHDPERARELLAEAGYPDGFSFEVVTSETEVYRLNYTVLQASLADVGIEMEIDVVDHPTMHATIREGSNAIVVYNAPRPTTDQLQFHFLHGDSIVVEGESPITNFAYYEGADDLIEEAQAEIDPERQDELWREVSLRILEDAVTLPSHHLVYSWGQSVDYDPGHEPRAYMHSATATINELTGFTSE